MKKLFLIILLVLCGALGVLAGQAQALVTASPCSNATEKWNDLSLLKKYNLQGYSTDPFSCIYVEKAACNDFNNLAACHPDLKKYVYLRDQNQGCKDLCSQSGPKGAAQLCYCVREADCTSITNIEGTAGKCCTSTNCYKNDGSVSSSFTDAKADADKRNNDFVSLGYRCPYSEKMTCYVEQPRPAKPAPPPPPQPLPVLPQPTTTVVRPTINLNITGCCRQIVPEIPDNEDYQLNHFVQMAINIYDCIVCLVASFMLLMIVVGGFILLTSAGDAKKVQQGFNIIRAAVIGGLIVFASFLIVYFAVTALGGSFANLGKVQISSQ